MSARNISFNRSAIEEYRDARFWYADRSTAALEDFIDAVDAAVTRVVREYEAVANVKVSIRSGTKVSLHFGLL
jgi:hypothetical protein